MTEEEEIGTDDVYDEGFSGTDAPAPNIPQRFPPKRNPILPG